MDNTYTITETINGLIAIIAARDIVREKLLNDITGNPYLCTVERELEDAARELSRKLRMAIAA